MLSCKSTINKISTNAAENSRCDLLPYNNYSNNASCSETYNYIHIHIPSTGFRLSHLIVFLALTLAGPIANLPTTYPLLLQVRRGSNPPYTPQSHNY